MITSKSYIKEIWLLEQFQQQHQKQQIRIEKYTVHHASNIALDIVLSFSWWIYSKKVVEASQLHILLKKIDL
jgi:hypothetical protein